jgi:hypothetical protein
LNNELKELAEDLLELAEEEEEEEEEVLVVQKDLRMMT